MNREEFLNEVDTKIEELLNNSKEYCPDLELARKGLKERREELRTNLEIGKEQEDYSGLLNNGEMDQYRVYRLLNESQWAAMRGTRGMQFSLPMVLAGSSALCGTTMQDGELFNPYIHRTYMPREVIECMIGGGYKRKQPAHTLQDYTLNILGIGEKELLGTRTKEIKKDAYIRIVSRNVRKVVKKMLNALADEFKVVQNMKAHGTSTLLRYGYDEGTMQEIFETYLGEWNNVNEDGTMNLMNDKRDMSSSISGLARKVGEEFYRGLEATLSNMPEKIVPDANLTRTVSNEMHKFLMQSSNSGLDVYIQIGLVGAIRALSNRHSGLVLSEPDEAKEIWEDIAKLPEYDEATQEMNNKDRMYSQFSPEDNLSSLFTATNNLVFAIAETQKSMG